MLIFSTGCSVLKRASNANDEYKSDLKGYNLLDAIKKQNISNRSFFIPKAEIEISSKEINQRMIASIKFVFPDIYLVSLKSRTGIEAARIYFSNDTLLINDRINRKLYYGKPESLERKYGVSPSVLPIILGDFISDKMKSGEEVLCIDDKVNFEGNVKGIRIWYSADCKKRKIFRASGENSIEGDYIEMEYIKFMNTSVGFIPSQSNVSFRGFNVGIKIGRIDLPWEGTIEFIPGNKYDLIKLL